MILQFEEQFNKEDKAVLNVFSKFDKALYQIDNWPGVFLWNKDDALFLPINEEKELYDIFKIIRYEDNSFNYLRDQIGRKGKKKKYAYLFHMSDLHFGNKLAEKRTMRVVRILEDQISKIEENATIIPIISGDLMQSPKSSSKQSYIQFSELLLSKGFERPIHVLGNHDVDISGIMKLLTNQKAIISSLSNTSRIEIYEELKLAIIKFDSNTGGELAQGKIGQDQLMEIGNEIDSIKNKDSYTFIALLHHHPVEIENPSWYAREWYEALLGTKLFERTMKLVDADLFLEWIQNRGIKYILHGHKHIPNIKEHEDITIVAAGSTTGSVKHQDKGKTYLSYNLIKYDVEAKQPVSIAIVAEEIIGAGTKNILLHLI
ncbi:metallophosphoesterase [Bacteroides fragilis]|nr:metallophosphoesterase [Bacteroides fragilis]